MAEKGKTEFIRAKAGVQPRPIGKGRIVSVIVQNTLNNMNSTPNNSEVMLGGASGQPYQLIPGQDSPEIYAKDLEDIYIRVRDTVEEDEIIPGTPTDVTVIIFKERKDYDEK